MKIDVYTYIYLADVLSFKWKPMILNIAFSFSAGTDVKS